MIRAILFAALATLLAASVVDAADIDRTIADFKTHEEIKWVRNAAGTNEQAILFAGSYVIHYGGKVHYDGAKTVETIIQVWGMGPATSTPAEKR